jgi:hypothetical protein
MMSWESKAQNRVATYVLHVEHVPFNWAINLRRLRIPGPEPRGICALPFDHARNEAVRHFLSTDCEYLFFLDSDVLPPADAVERLLRWNRPFITGMYCRRSPPHSVPVMMIDHQWVTDLPKDPRAPLKEVELVGAGCMLIHRTVFEALTKHPHRPGKPWFDWRSDLHGIVPPGEALSEDYSFCFAVRKHLKVPVLVDTSIRCLHVGMAEADYGTFLPLGTTPRAA